MEADLHTYGFPAGYFVIKNVATGKLLDVQSDMVEDGTPVILYDETETSIVEGMTLSHRIPSLVDIALPHRHEETRVKQPGKMKSSRSVLSSEAEDV